VKKREGKGMKKLQELAQCGGRLKPEQLMKWKSVSCCLNKK
jgi:hypothetical protein